ncbi:MAG: prepilin peptidase, partial [Pseudomonadota bacterium]
MIIDASLVTDILPIAGSLLGLIVGSFLATLIVRWPLGKSITTGRSKCDSCEKQLAPSELIPVVSYVWQKGRCVDCGEAINTHHLAIELTSALVGALALYVAPNIIGLAGAFFGWLLLTLASLDAEHQWLPDRLTAILAISGISSALIIRDPILVDRIIGGLVGYFSLALIAIAYRKLRGREGLGGGDPKMLAGIGIWLGWQYLPIVLIGASVTGLVLVISA